MYDHNIVAGDVGAYDFNQKLGKNWGTDLQNLSHNKTPLAVVKSIETNKDPLQGKTQRQKKNSEAARLHKEA